MVTSSKVNFMYPSVTENNTEHYTLFMYISMFLCFFNVSSLDWSLYTSCYFYAVAVTMTLITADNLFRHVFSAIT